MAASLKSSEEAVPESESGVYAPLCSVIVAAVFCILFIGISHSHHLSSDMFYCKRVECCSLFGYNIAMNLKLIGGVHMQPIIKPSSELRKNYNSIAEICRTNKTPVFLTKNGEGDTVIMDMETYGRREDDLAVAERLLAAERARLAGTKGYTVDEFRNNMREAVEKGARTRGV
jgi:PHD/YefM family antitoxin component YafN of YafNO toxin-antitoxin module